jgi:hypothetical protein
LWSLTPHSIPTSLGEITLSIMPPTPTRTHVVFSERSLPFAQIEMAFDRRID